MPQIILKERTVRLGSYTFLQAMLINIKTRHFHSSINHIVKSFANFTEKHLCWSPFLKDLWAEGLQLHKQRLQHSCFAVKFAKFLKAHSKV